MNQKFFFQTQTSILYSDRLSHEPFFFFVTGLCLAHFKLANKKFLDASVTKQLENSANAAAAAEAAKVIHQIQIFDQLRQQRTPEMNENTGNNGGQSTKGWMGKKSERKMKKKGNRNK